MHYFIPSGMVILKVNAIGTEKNPMFKSSIVTAITLLLWDYILTFQSESTKFKKYLGLKSIVGPTQEWSYFPISNLLINHDMLQNRYLAVVAQLVTTYAHVSSNVTYEFCVFAIAYWLIGTSTVNLVEIEMKLTPIIGILQLALTDGIVWLSVCSLYRNTSAVRWPLLGLMITCMLCGVSVVGVVGSHSKGLSLIGGDNSFFLNRQQCLGAAELAPGFKQCTVYTQYHNLWLFWLFIQYRRNRKEWTSNLLELLLNDMLLYLAIIFVAFIGNTILFANPDVGNHMLLRAESKRAAQGMIYQSGVRDPGTPGPGEGGRRNIPEQGDLGITGTGLETMVFTTATV
ncbi:hypothetical protein C8J55DRAFT_493520 [Lentinula edodes]|uniref:Uncharacterized protein n=1 Tax=Lentinula lateritia TaxID=40482 RepID=A0A9W8ZRS4_9AGAR|nr:hypothetical protein C8J55DRAFT_493520 [Lentinula edodes]